MAEATPLKGFWNLGQWKETCAAPWARRWILPEAMGKGIIYRYNLPSGMNLFVSHVELSEPGRFAVASDQTNISFYFCLSGKGRVQVEDSRDEFTHTKGNVGFYVKPAGCNGVIEDPGGELVRTVSVDLPLDRFEQLALSPGMGIPGLLSWTMELGRSQFASVSFPGSPMIRAVVNQVLNHPFSQNLDSRMFLEAKAWEMMACIISQAGKNPGVRPLSIPLYRDELDRLHHVRKILASNMTAPPSLAELSRRAGMNHFKLNQAFKQVFGATVFGVLREIRLEAAREMLVSGQMNVTQTSLHVGYSCVSHFAKAFKTQYGINPSDCLGKSF